MPVKDEHEVVDYRPLGVFSCNIFAEFLGKIKEKRFDEIRRMYYEEMKTDCENAFKAVTVNKANVHGHSWKFTFTFAAIYILLHQSLSAYKSFLRKSKINCVNKQKVIISCCIVLKSSNGFILKQFSANTNESINIAKCEILKEHLNEELKRKPVITSHLLFVLKCAKELGDPDLLCKTTSFLRKFKTFCDCPHYFCKCCSVAVSENSQVDEEYDNDGIVYDRATDPPGQRSAYIPPGDPRGELYRLSTFLKFPDDAPVNARQLAAVGFFFTGYRDRVKCFCCGLCVQNWAVGDDVKDRRWHREDCQMMKGEECGNIPKDFYSGFTCAASQPTTSSSATLHQTQTPSAPSSTNNTSTMQQSNISTTPAGNILLSRNGAPFQQSARPVRSHPATVEPTTLQLATITSVYHENLIRSLNLTQEADRLKTFEYWPTEPRNVHPSDLARSGFFYLGNADRTQCFSCGGVLRSWGYGDNVDIEHRRLFPQCRLLRGVESRNIPLTPQEQTAPSTTAGQEPPDPSASEQVELQNRYPCQYPANPHMMNEEARLATFDRRWPARRVQAPPEQIAKAGFFFLGERDRVQCFYCNGGLQNWEPTDEPFTEHAKWFPTCEFIIRKKGPSFVNHMVALFPNIPRPVLRSSHDVPPPASQARFGASVRSRSPLPTVMDPRAEMKRIRETLRTAMHSDMVRTVVDMGFESRVVRKKIKRKLRDGGAMYSSVSELVDDLTAAGDVSDSGDDGRSSSPLESLRVTETSNQSGESQPMESAASLPSISTGGETTTPKRSDVPPGATSLPQDLSLSMESRMRELEDERKCKICLDKEADIVFIPCGHLCCCKSCAEAIRLCPICRARIQKAIRTYLT